ncbi:MAG: hypothetical protein BMS9Abin26_0937 [Gammaproteobacteria bacterium]|nr:MAG: hypothetical protein BMS9Abin26_0937 [Gammaproteobacteria bacterium]
MKLNTIVQVMTFMLLVTVAAGVYYLYSQWYSSVLDDARIHTESTVKNLHHEISTYLDAQAKPVKTLASMPAISKALNNQSPEILQQANYLLDTFCSTLEALTCYLMDGKGTTIASSNRHSRKSFVGKNYSFRPYFRNAINGDPNVYLALGVTSKKRGIYFSHPVVTDNKIPGVVVIKVSVADLEQKFTNTPGIAVLNGLDGMVFATNRQDWLFKSLWSLSAERAKQLASSRQFGDTLPASVGLKRNEQGEVVDRKARSYLIGQKAVAAIPGWEITYLYNTQQIDQTQGVLNRIFSSNVGALLLLLAAITLFLYLVAKKEIQIRKQADRDMAMAREVAELASQTKSEFLSRMSHELRTPLNAILGFGQILELDAEQLNETQYDHVKQILFAGQHLLDLIDEILDLAKIESGKLNVEMGEVSVDELVHDCLSLVAIQATERHIALIDRLSGKDYTVQADFMRLKQVLLNLLSNAVKYNSNHGSITLDGEVIDQQYLRISVTDTGEGMTTEQIERLFTSFDRHSGRHVEGTGIGLVITKGLVELMGGKVGVESIPGMGSNFWVELNVV